MLPQFVWFVVELGLWTSSLALTLCDKKKARIKIYWDPCGLHPENECTLNAMYMYVVYTDYLATYCNTE